jgi:hypothetical protein
VIPVAGGRPTKLTEDLLVEVEKLCSRGLPDCMVRAVADVSDRTWKRWLEAAETAEPDSLHYRFRRITQSGVAKVNSRYLGYLHEQAENGNVNAITWYLTHHPKLREVWSDAAAERRAVAAAMAPVSKALATLPPEQRLSLVLAIEAEGGRLPEADDEPDS